MKPSLRREARQIARFLLFGTCTSLTSVLTYALLQQVLPIAVAYTLAYALGIALSALLSGQVVFEVRTPSSVRAKAFVGYATVFGVGLGVVWLLQDGWELSALVAAAGSLLVTAPANYAVGRWLFTVRNDSDDLSS